MQDIQTSDYRSMGYEELLALHAHIGTILSEKRTEEENNLREEVLLKASKLGIDIEALFSKKAVKTQKPKAVVKFRDPANPENIWSGRGRPAAWMQNYLDEGRTKEEFAV